MKTKNTWAWLTLWSILLFIGVIFFFNLARLLFSAPSDIAVIAGAAIYIATIIFGFMLGTKLAKAWNKYSQESNPE